MKLLVDCLPLVIAACFASSGLAQQLPHHQHMKNMRVQPFNEKTWNAIVSSGPRPAAYLFTTSYCSTCPEAFAVIHAATIQLKRKSELAAVMMDVEGEKARRHAVHFQGMSKLYAFDGYEPAIRHAVDPHWQNITPYVILIDRHGAMQRMVGSPPKDALQRWLQ